MSPGFSLRKWTGIVLFKLERIGGGTVRGERVKFGDHVWIFELCSLEKEPKLSLDPVFWWEGTTDADLLRTEMSLHEDDMAEK